MNGISLLLYDTKRCIMMLCWEFWDRKTVHLMFQREDAFALLIVFL